MANQDLQNYIKQAREFGKTDDQIRQELLAAGWQSSQIDEELGYSNKYPLQFPSKFEKFFQYLVLSVSAAISILCFFSKWAINAESFGKYNLGYAISFAFLLAYLIYFSLGMAFLSFTVMIINLLRHRSVRVYLWATIVVLLPISYLFILDIF